MLESGFQVSESGSGVPQFRSFGVVSRVSEHRSWVSEFRTFCTGARQVMEFPNVVSHSGMLFRSSGTGLLTSRVGFGALA